ncbi:MAG: DUF2807 domain-containing protein [Bacteroidales bacterium]|nr:DUF2807 domain-containing protein [Bacteroidales bacterium]
MKIQIFITLMIIALFKFMPNQDLISLPPDYVYLTPGVETPFAEFKSIDFDAVASVFYQKGDKYSVRLECPDNMVDHIKFKVEEQELKIKSDKKNSHKISVYITSPDLYSVEIDGVGSFNSTEPLFLNHDFEFEHNGVGSVTIENLECLNCKIEKDGVGSSYLSIKAKNIDLDVDGVGATELNVDCDFIKIDKDGVGSLTVTGKTGFYQIEKNGVGSVNTSKLTSINQ